MAEIGVEIKGVVEINGDMRKRERERERERERFNKIIRSFLVFLNVQF